MLCLKPTTSARNDILLKQGDFIEEIIFVKSGKIQLETIIKLEGEFEKNITKNNNDISNTPKFNKNQIRIEKIKILDLRKNEHFGVYLMIHNLRSPLTLRTKTKSADLMLMSKLDVIRLSDDFSTIFEKIYEISTRNLQSIMLKIETLKEKEINHNKKLKLNIKLNNTKEKINDNIVKKNSESSDNFELENKPINDINITNISKNEKDSKLNKSFAEIISNRILNKSINDFLEFDNISNSNNNFENINKFEKYNCSESKSNKFNTANLRKNAYAKNSETNLSTYGKISNKKKTFLNNSKYDIDCSKASRIYSKKSSSSVNSWKKSNIGNSVYKYNTISDLDMNNSINRKSSLLRQRKDSEYKHISYKKRLSEFKFENNLEDSIILKQISKNNSNSKIMNNDKMSEILNKSFVDKFTKSSQNSSFEILDFKNQSMRNSILLLPKTEKSKKSNIVDYQSSIKSYSFSNKEDLIAEEAKDVNLNDFKIKLSSRNKQEQKFNYYKNDSNKSKINISKNFEEDTYNISKFNFFNYKKENLFKENSLNIKNKFINNINENIIPIDNLENIKLNQNLIHKELIRNDFFKVKPNHGDLNYTLGKSHTAKSLICSNYLKKYSFQENTSEKRKLIEKSKKEEIFLCEKCYCFIETRKNKIKKKSFELYDEEYKIEKVNSMSLLCSTDDSNSKKDNNNNNISILIKKNPIYKNINIKNNNININNIHIKNNNNFPINFEKDNNINDNLIIEDLKENNEKPKLENRINKNKHLNPIQNLKGSSTNIEAYGNDVSYQIGEINLSKYDDYFNDTSKNIINIQSKSHSNQNKEDGSITKRESIYSNNRKIDNDYKKSFLNKRENTDKNMKNYKNGSEEINLQKLGLPNECNSLREVINKIPNFSKKYSNIDKRNSKLNVFNMMYDKNLSKINKYSRINKYIKKNHFGRSLTRFSKKDRKLDLSKKKTILGNKQISIKSNKSEFRMNKLSLDNDLKIKKVNDDVIFYNKYSSSSASSSYENTDKRLNSQDLLSKYLSSSGLNNSKNDNTNIKDFSKNSKKKESGYIEKLDNIEEFYKINSNKIQNKKNINLISINNISHDFNQINDPKRNSRKFLDFKRGNLSLNSKNILESVIKKSIITVNKHKKNKVNELSIIKRLDNILNKLKF